MGRNMEEEGREERERRRTGVNRRGIVVGLGNRGRIGVEERGRRGNIVKVGGTLRRKGGKEG